MENIWQITILTLILALSTFAVGILPLSFTFSIKRKHQLSVLGNGLLLGAALGIIIPEGIESVSASSRTVPTSTIALSLLIGFGSMLIIEQYLSPHSHSSTRAQYQMTTLSEHRTTSVNADSDLPRNVDQLGENTENFSQRQDKAYPLTFGLVIHSLTDGLALGASAVSEDSSDMGLSLAVFFALIIHKTPTALALTSSLLSTSLARSEIRKHVAIFSMATPVGALCSYGLLNFAGTAAGDWTGIALLISGGTFLYVATVIQSISTHSHDIPDSQRTESLGKFQRVSLLMLGIFLPYIIGSILVHHHH